MSEIVKGVLAGGLSLVTGWVVPVAVNLLLALVLILPSVHPTGTDLGAPGTAAWLVGLSVVGGLVLNMLQTPLYRILEGYLGWPQAAGRRRHQRRKARIIERLDLIRRYRIAMSAAATDTDSFAGMPARDRRRSAPQRALLREALRRYPVDDDQVLPTLLGNAIRRFEEYGWNHYRLDSQSLWSRLITVVSEPLRRPVDNAQVGIDFFVCLLYGQCAVSVTALGVLISSSGNPAPLLAVALGPVALAPIWYRLAEVTTDQWAAAVQALVDLGREPLASALGLRLPDSIEQERVMWERVSRFASREFGLTRR